ncbi:MAG: hypothetical protein SPF70_00355, partial [Lachnospiraceae bacterium]|nr:hypothetical protein [Lachnospiraceae bacterium]
MDEKNVTKKVSKKEARRKRNMRNTIMMAVICVLLLSGATYAWFTLSNTAKVTNMTLKVGEASGLQIADDNNGNWGSVIELATGTTGAKLLPATMVTKGTIQKPIYNDKGEVSQLVALTEGDSMTYEDSISANGNGKKIYCVTKVFYLKTEQGDANSTFDVFLSKGVNGENGTVSTNG